MLKMRKKGLAFLLLVFMTASLAAGCGSGAPAAATTAAETAATTAAPATTAAAAASDAETAAAAAAETETEAEAEAATTAAAAATTAAATAAAAEATAAAAAADAQTREDITIISFYGSPNAVVQSVVGDKPDDTPEAKKYQEIFFDKYGFHLNHEYIFTGAEETIQKQQLILASGEPWDTMGGIQWAYPTRISGAGKDGIIVDWLQYPEHIPNILALGAEHPELFLQVKTDEGALYSIGEVNLSKMSSIWFGPMIRRDLLKQVGINELPETIQEWHDDLITLKEAGLPCQFSYTLIWFDGYSNAMVSAWDGAGYPQTDGGRSMIVDDSHHIVYGCASEGYREWLTEMNKWFNEGILDPDGFTNPDWGAADTNFSTGKIAGGLHFLGSLGSNDTQGKTLDPNFDLAATKYPVLNKGDQPRMGQWDPMAIPGDFINTKSQYITEILDWIDIAYSEEGQILTNYGIEGITFNMVNGQREFTDYYLCEGPDNTNSDGYNRSQIRTMYCLSTGVAWPDVWYGDNTQTQAQADAIPLWNDVQRPADECQFLSLNDAETSASLGRVDLDTYVTQQMLQFIFGERPISDYDNYVNELRTVYKMDEITAAYDSAFQRYINR